MKQNNKTKYKSNAKKWKTKPLKALYSPFLHRFNFTVESLRDVRYAALHLAEGTYF